MFRRTSILFALLLGALAVAPASASYEGELASRTNSSRASAGLRSYPGRTDLTSVARRQASRMAAAHRMYHNPYLESEVGNWRAVGENVGVGSSIAAIHSAFMGSPSHRSNILSTLFTEVGYGAVRGSDGRLYVSEVFRRPQSGYVAPTRTYRTPPKRASRSTVRRRVPAVVKPPVKRPPAVDPVPGRLKSAWVIYRRTRPLGSIDRAIQYTRTCLLLGA